MILKFNRSQIEKYIKFSKFTCEKHPTEDLYIYGYISNKSKGGEIVWDNINIHLRGIILNEKGDIIQRSFPKFHTFKKYITKNKIGLSDNQILTLPSCKFKIYEKLDGSMAMLYWVNDKPFLASQRSFKSINAVKATEILYKKYQKAFNRLNKKHSYIFEVINPETRVMVDYSDVEDLVLIGIIETKTGNELKLTNIGFPIAKDYTRVYGHITDLEELSRLNLPNIEGFVLHYENGLKVKIKFPWFSEAHLIANKIIKYNKIIFENKQRLFSSLNLNKKSITNYQIWELLCNNHYIESIKLNIPEEFYYYGFEIWFNDILENFKSEFRKVKKNEPDISESEIWEKIKPEFINIFDLNERLDLPEFYSPMWNLINRISKTYI